VEPNSPAAQALVGGRGCVNRRSASSRKSPSRDISSCGFRNRPPGHVHDQDPVGVTDCAQAVSDHDPGRRQPPHARASLSWAMVAEGMPPPQPATARMSMPRTCPASLCWCARWTAAMGMTPRSPTGSPRPRSAWRPAPAHADRGPSRATGCGCGGPGTDRGSGRGAARMRLLRKAPGRSSTSRCGPVNVDAAGVVSLIAHCSTRYPAVSSAAGR
jgi:hypothetical protein